MIRDQNKKKYSDIFERAILRPFSSFDRMGTHSVTSCTLTGIHPAPISVKRIGWRQRWEQVSNSLTAQTFTRNRFSGILEKNL